MAFCKSFAKLHPLSGTVRPHSRRVTEPPARSRNGSAEPWCRCARTCRPPSAGRGGAACGAGGGRWGRCSARVRPTMCPRTCVVRGRRVPELRGAGPGVGEGRFPRRRRRPLAAAAAAAQRWRRAVRHSPRAAGGGALPPSAGSSAAWVVSSPAAGVGEHGCECGCSWFAAAAAAAEEEEDESEATGEEGGRRGGSGGGARGRRRRGGWRWRTCSVSCDSTTSRRRRLWWRETKWSSASSPGPRMWRPTMSSGGTSGRAVAGQSRAPPGDLFPGPSPPTPVPFGDGGERGAPGKSFSRQQKLHLLVRREREELRLEWSLPLSRGKLKGKGLRRCVASPVRSGRCEGSGCLQCVGVHGGAHRVPPETSLFVLQWFSLAPSLLPSLPLRGCPVL